MAEKSDHRRQFGSISNIEVRSSSWEGGVEVIERLPAQENTEISLFESLERVGRVGVGLGGIVDGGDPIVEDNQTTTIPRRRRGRRRNSLVEVGSAIWRDVSIRSHGPRGDEGLGAVEGHVNAECLFISLYQLPNLAQLRS